MPARRARIQPEPVRATSSGAVQQRQPFGKAWRKTASSWAAAHGLEDVARTAPGWMRAPGRGIVLAHASPCSRRCRNWRWSWSTRSTTPRSSSRKACATLRETSRYRAKLAGCPAILGTATPSLETWHNCIGRYERLELPDALCRAPAAGIRTIDLRHASLHQGLAHPYGCNRSAA